MSVLKFLSLNVRGLRNEEKTRSRFPYLKSQKANVYLLQETFPNSKDGKIWAAEWGGQIFYSHGSNHSKGVCVLKKPNSPLHVEIVELDINGRFIILSLKTPGEINLNVVVVYAPTDPILFSNVECAVINGGYMTKYFKVSRGVRQGCPLSPLLFVLGVEILAQKIGQSAGCRGIKLLQSVAAKISQFANDTTLICRDVDALMENIEDIRELNAISGLELNKNKTKAVWIGSTKDNKAKPSGCESHLEPVKSLGVNLSLNRDKNNNLNFFVKISKMDAKLNMWQTRDLTLFGRTMLVKTLGISKLVCAASMLCVSELVIKTVQEKILKFLWKNKTDKVKRSVLYEPLSHGGLNFTNFHTVLELDRQVFKLHK